MPWLILFVAGLLEVVWALMLKQSEGFSKPGPTAVFVIALLFSMFLLHRPIRGRFRCHRLNRLHGLDRLHRLHWLHWLGRGIVCATAQNRLVLRFRPLGLEHGRRFAGTQIEDLIDGHICRVGFLMRDRRHRIVE